MSKDNKVVRPFGLRDKVAICLEILVTTLRLCYHQSSC